MRALVLPVGIFLLVSSIPQSSTAAQVTVAWDASTDPNVTGYNLYYGGASQQYTNVLPAVTNSITVSNLTSGATYYFAATAMNSAGLESLFSTEVSCLVAGTNGCIVNLSNLAQVYDGTPKTASVSTSPAGLAVALTYNGRSNSPVAAGTYQVIATVTSPGYVGGATNTLTISKAVASVQILGLNAQTYNGTAKVVSASTTPAGLAVILTYNGSASAPTNAGSYQVVANVDDTNYAGTASATLVIAKAAGQVQLSNLTQTYDGTPKSVTATTLPAGMSVLVTYNGLAQPPFKAGSYTVVGTISDLNYSGAATNKLTIAKPKGRTGATTALAIKSTTAAAQIVLSWPATENPVTILSSTDLLTWTTLTNVPGASASLTILQQQQQQSEFFMATWTNSTSTNRVPIDVQAQ